MSQIADPHQNLHIIEDHNFEENTIIKYRKGDFLGKGGFARCFQIIDTETQDIFAVKIIQKSSLVKQRSKLKLMSEIKIHQNLHHKNIVKFLHNFEDNQNVYIMLELCPNKTLNDLIKRKKRLTEAEVKYFMLQVLEGLEYLHNQKIVHRDLKLGNLFLGENMTIKIGDYGLASKIQFYGEKKKTICGTPNYIAPEILEGRGHSYEVDVWSFGVIVYTLIFGRPPFESKEVKQTYKKIKAVTFGFPQSPSISPSLKHLIVTTLQREPHKRPTIKQLLQFDFFKEVNLSRQPSICFKSTYQQLSANKDDKQASDNGKIYTNNDMLTSKDTARGKSNDRFLATDRTASINKFSIKSNNTQSDIKRTKSQRVLKDLSSNNYEKFNHGTQRTVEPFTYISVKKWIDYSSKYGIGYSLSNGSIGVYFNDSTKILAFDEDKFCYIQKIDKEDITKKYFFKDHPYELKKKVSLFNHFKGYLHNETQNKIINPKSQPQSSKLVYVRRWFRSKHAVIFRLSNKSVQVIFIDQSQLLINSINKQVTYTNKHKDRIDYALGEIMQSQNRELIKRFQYTKEILNEMASSHENKRI